MEGREEKTHACVLHVFSNSAGCMLAWMQPCIQACPCTSGPMHIRPMSCIHAQPCVWVVTDMSSHAGANLKPSTLWPPITFADLSIIRDILEVYEQWRILSAASIYTLISVPQEDVIPSPTGMNSLCSYVTIAMILARVIDDAMVLWYGPVILNPYTTIITPS